MSNLTSDQYDQIKLIAFGSCTKYGPDGQLGGSYTRAVKLFQEKVMGDSNPDGIVGPKTRTSIDAMLVNSRLTIDGCPCGACDGYGNGLHKGKYRAGKPEIEAYYQYEYPSISTMTEWAAYGIVAMYPQYEWAVSSSYRCHENNKQHGRLSTNHMGKALDIVPTSVYNDERIKLCADIRNELSSGNMSNSFQVGWATSNKLALEPSRIAPTWIHLDCRQFARKWIELTT